MQVDISSYNHRKDRKETVKRIIWFVVYYTIFKVLFLRPFREYKSIILRKFGAQIGKGCLVHSTAKIWAPWNMELGDYVCIGPYVNFYNQGIIKVGSNTTISQYSTLCASGHDITDSKNPLIRHSITIEDQVWIATEAFIGPKVLIGQGAVVGARSAVFKNIDSWTVVGGNPASFLKKRILVK